LQGVRCRQATNSAPEDCDRARYALGF
jgi:hypothetical protein